MKKLLCESVYGKIYKTEDGIEKHMPMSEICWLREVAVYAVLSNFNESKNDSKINDSKINDLLPQCNKVVINEKDVILHMPYYGKNLSELLHKLSFQKINLYFIQLLQAVDFLHSQKIIHRDIKLENAVVSDDKCRLIDFTLSYVYSSEKYVPMDDDVVSWAYRAPEVIQRDLYDEKIDEWALGVLLYTMLEGEFPVVGLGIKKEKDFANFRFEQEEIDKLVDKNIKNKKFSECIKGLLKVDAKERKTCRQILKILEAEPINVQYFPLFKHTIPTSYNYYDTSRYTSECLKIITEHGNLPKEIKKKISNLDNFAICFRMIRIIIMLDDIDRKLNSYHFSVNNSDIHWPNLFPFVISCIFNSNLHIVKPEYENENNDKNK